MNTITARINQSLVVVCAMALSSIASAAPDYASLTAAVDLGSTETAVLGIFAAVAGLAVLIMGGRKIIGAIRKG